MARRRAASLVLLGLVACEADCEPRVWRPKVRDEPEGQCAEAFEDGAPVIGPHRDQWQIEAELPFPETIESITIGGRLTSGSSQNFANRGDVIVEHDGPPGRIRIEMRRFSHAVCEDAAREDFEQLSLMGFTPAHEPPVPPSQLRPELSCLGVSWRDDCAIRVAFDGITQLARAGADLRVTLPAGWRGHLEVITEDNDADAAYSNRGDVCVHGLSGSADIELQSGRAFVSLARDTTPQPRCSDEGVDRCEAWPCASDDDVCDGSRAWASDCPCLAQEVGFGFVRITSREDEAADMHVDVPAGLWTTIAASSPEAARLAGGAEAHCEAIVDLPGWEPAASSASDSPWEALGHAAYPGPPAIPGAGYQVQLLSRACTPVAHTDEPAGFVGPGNALLQPTERRGDLTVCSGCLADLPCDELVP